MAVPISIAGSAKTIGGDGVFVIAEIGKNFIQTEEERPREEYLANAVALIDAAAEAGADAVKFQTHELEDEFMPGLTVVSPHFSGSDRYRWIKRNMEATPPEFWHAVKARAEERGLVFFSTPMSRRAAERLQSLGVPIWKLGSGDVQDYATLDFIASTGKPLIISTGMVGLAELSELVAHIRSLRVPLVVLYCISQYPAPAEYFNLATIESLREEYPDVVIGFSDHSLGESIALAAVKLGARVIEKHFSFSRELWGADHKVSMTPDEFALMVRAIRSGSYKSIDPSPYYGSCDRELEGANNKFRPYFNKALVAGCDMPAGTVITKKMIYAMRPKMYIDGLAANRFYEVVGKRAARDMKKYQPVKTDDLA
ncbi:MAG: N-acetylneuraminate synthase family protein [bacterium]|nr:N-acetylneuraminate synthase family protein [bacterium]MDZ4285249.1 N-acetylneuraminate synthase family protein [Patescibacteria group bacterium]